MSARCVARLSAASALLALGAPSFVVAGCSAGDATSSADGAGAAARPAAAAVAAREGATSRAAAVTRTLARLHGPEHEGMPELPAPGDPRFPPLDEATLALPVVTGNPPVATGGDASLPRKTLVLYDQSGAWGYLGEFYAMYSANLASHFGTWTAKPVTAYAAGNMSTFDAVIYIGSSFGETLPTAFLDDVLAGTKPVIWAGYNIYQLSARSASFATTYGYALGPLDASLVFHQVSYKQQLLDRSTFNDGYEVQSIASLDTSVATVLAQGVAPDGMQIPWALKSHNLWYLAENPTTYAREGDRVLAFADMLFDVLAPATTERHRAMLRLEDVNAADDMAQLTTLSDYLSSVGVPFCVATIPYYTDPLGYYNGGVAETMRLSRSSAFITTLKHMQSKGGTLIMHGYTHQWSNVYNPYSGVSADDFEFYRAHVDTSNAVILDGPVTGDTTAWATGRLNSGLGEFTSAGLAKPTIFEFPHYAGSQVDYLAAASLFGTRYERGLYFVGALRGVAPSYTNVVGQWFPYVVKDIYGMKVLPENLGNFEPQPYNTNAPRMPADMVLAAKRNLVVRDGFASTFYHPYYYSDTVVTADGTTTGIQALQQTIAGIKALGYTFVSCGSL